MRTSQLNNIRIGITAGDAAGIGPEIILKALAKVKDKSVSFLIIGDYEVFKKVKTKLARRGINYLPRGVNFLDMNIIGKRSYKLGRPSKLCGRASIAYIKEAANLIRDKKIDALVTAPINKEAISLAGCKWRGHTELLAHLAGIEEVAMMFVAEQFKIILVTTHVALSKVNKILNPRLILKKIELADRYLKGYFRIKRPLIGVCGFNPHASDGGLFGKEECDSILPAVKMAKRKKINVMGPESAESLFHQAYHGKIDALICMYHDQALIPLKMILRDKAVNLTIGLPYIRTSPSSGTAYDISARTIARPESMIEAVKLAASLTRIKKARL
ncbi:MAG: 4-hydroxythreonine-4-phosphate dehydrogenase PdxA [Candidatus Omnitrophica bacterium]|nr:4-hydroxythreonine-4-phosphate dehydrogenase PdxA [Candidatus Omnitrophota bacterium]